jgi:hypothetical protein
MNRTPPKPQIQYASDGTGLATKLRDCQGYIIMPKAILTTLGPLAARLAGSLMAERRPTRADEYREVQQIAADACLSIWTARNLLRRLVSAGWLEHRGRQAMAVGRRCRRTVTYRITPKTWQNRRPWLPWPCFIKDYPQMPPAAQSIYGLVMARWCLVESTWNDNGNADGRQVLTMKEISRETGLSRHGVSIGLDWLLQGFIVDRDGEYDLMCQGREHGK